MPIIPLLRSSVYGGSTVRLVAWLLFVFFLCVCVYLFWGGVLLLFCVCCFVRLGGCFCCCFRETNCIFNGEGEGLTSEH